MSVVLVATIVPIPEHRAEVIAAFEEVIPLVHAEEGCELYSLHEGEDRLVMIEKWADQEALDVHSKSPNLGTLNGKLKGKLAGKLDLQVLRQHPAGTGAQGAL
jgi:quinol monooxygenase YgiN